MDSVIVIRLAVVSAFVAIPSLVLAGYYAVLFFGGRGDRYGPLNDFFSATTLLLLILPAIGVWLVARDATGVWLDIVTWLAVGGMAIGAAGQFLLIMGGISLETSFTTGGLGIVPVFAWWTALAVAAFASDALWPVTGGLSVAVIALSVLLASAYGTRLKAAVVPLSAALALALAAWMGVLGADLLGRA